MRGVRGVRGVRAGRYTRPLLVALLLAGCAARPAALEPLDGRADPLMIRDLAPGDRYVAALLRRVVEAADSVTTLWPGYWAAGTEFLVGGFAGAALLVSPRSPPTEAGRPLVGDPGDLLAARSVLVADTAPYLSVFELARNFNGRSVLAIAPAVLPLGEEQLLLMLYHEAFHVFQMAAFESAAGRGLPHTNADARPLADAGVRAALAVERRVLREALLAEGAAARAPLLRSYLALRGERRRTFPSVLGEHERALERFEGSAQIVGYHAAAATLQSGPARLRPLIAASLLDPSLDDLARDPLRRHAYATGSAMALMLDELTADWRERITRGDDFTVLLAAVTGFDAASPAAAAAADSARRAFDHDGWLRRFLAEGPVADPVEDFETHAGVHIVLIGTRFDESAYHGRISDLVPRTRVYTRGTTLTMKGATASLESRGLSVLDDGRSSPSRFVVLLPGGVELNGQPPTPGETEYPTVRIAAEDLDVRVDAPATVSWDGRRLVVTVQPVRPRAP
jgi:hypothetical protein